VIIVVRGSICIALVICIWEEARIQTEFSLSNKKSDQLGSLGEDCNIFLL
jgi:hypothetical protein